MKPDHSYWNQIDDYLHGRLSPEAEQAMEQAIQADNKLQQEVQQQEKIVKGLRQLRLEALTEQAKSWEAEIQEEETLSPAQQPHKPARTIRLRTWIIAAAATVAILIIATLILNRPSPEQLQRLAIQAFAMPAVQGTRAAGDSPYSKGMEYFQNNDYTNTVQQMALVPSSDTNYGGAQFLLGLCQFEQGAYANALNHFQTAKQQENPIMILIGTPPDNKIVSTKHLDWYMALSLLANGQQQAGRQIVKGIRADSSHPYFSAAKAMLK